MTRFHAPGLRPLQWVTGSSSAEDIRASLWFWPSMMWVCSLGLTFGLLTVRPDPHSWVGEVGWPGDASSASTMVQLVATAVTTATTLLLSLTVVALQLASQQFSPRLLRTFARDRQIQLSLGLLLSTVVVALTTLRGIDPERPLPVLALGLTWLLGLVSLVVLLAFVAHIVRSLRVDTMMAHVHAQTVGAVEASYAPWGQGPEAPGDDVTGEAGGELVPSPRSGFVRSINPDALIRVAREHGILLRMRLRPGDSVVQGTPAANARRVEGNGRLDVSALADALLEGVSLGHERTAEQDVAFGFRELVDIAVKAISPGINDPTTAAEALNYLSDLVVRLQDRRLGSQLKRDDDGVPRLVLPDRDHRYYLDLACAQLRRFGAEQPEVLTALLRLLRDAAGNARTDDQRAEIARQAALVLQTMSEHLVEEDERSVRELGRRVELALSGDLAAAYDDRAGETRSI